MKLPKRVYIKIEKPTSEDEDYYMISTACVDDLAEMGERVDVGEYKLVRKMKLKTVIRIK